MKTQPLKCGCVDSFRPIGVAEFAELCGVTKQVICNWRKRYSDFPQPMQELAIGPLWLQWQARLWIQLWNTQREEKLKKASDKLKGDSVMEKPKVYLFKTEQGVEVSNVPFDHEKRDVNFIEVAEVHRPVYPQAVSNIIGNILRNAGVEVVEEN
jgi:hypothetical protein